MKDCSKLCTTDGRPPIDPDAPGAPGPVDPKTGQHSQYWVLCEEERKKGFVRPYRDRYIHRGKRPKYPLRDLTDEEKERYSKFGYAKYEKYPENPDSAVIGRFWKEEDLNSGCGAETTMGRALSETYAADPTFYGSTFCCNCGRHFPVGEFVWSVDGEVVGS